MEGVSRAAIRRTVANMLDDFYAVEATEDGGENFVIDTLNLAQETGFFKGMQILFTGGDVANVGHAARVVQSDGIISSVTFNPPLPVATTVGTTAEMYNRRSMGSTIQQYNEAINAAIQIAREQYAMIPVTETLTGPFNYLTPTMTIPDNFTAISGVRANIYDHRYGRNVDWAVPSKYISIDRGTRVITIREGGWHKLNEGVVTLYGYTLPELLTTDSDVTMIDTNWIFSEVKAQLLERKMAAGLPVGAQDRLYLQERQGADGRIGLTMTRYAPNTIRLT